MNLVDSTKYDILKQAAAITTSAVSSGNYTPDAAVMILEKTYQKMIELATKA